MKIHKHKISNKVILWATN